MSTYYELVCDKHKERTNAVSCVAGGGFSPMWDEVQELLSFIVGHADCWLRVVNEYQDDWHNDEYKEWSKDNDEYQAQGETA